MRLVLFYKSQFYYFYFIILKITKTRLNNLIVNQTATVNIIKSRSNDVIGIII